MGDRNHLVNEEHCPYDEGQHQHALPEQLHPADLLFMIPEGQCPLHNEQTPVSTNSNPNAQDAPSTTAEEDQQQPSISIPIPTLPSSNVENNCPLHQNQAVHQHNAFQTFPRAESMCPSHQPQQSSSYTIITSAHIPTQRSTAQETQQPPQRQTQRTASHDIQKTPQQQTQLPPSREGQRTPANNNATQPQRPPPSQEGYQHYHHHTPPNNNAHQQRPMSAHTSQPPPPSNPQKLQPQTPDYATPPHQHQQHPYYTYTKQSDNNNERVRYEMNNDSFAPGHATPNPNHQQQPHNHHHHASQGAHHQHAQTPSNGTSPSRSQFRLVRSNHHDLYRGNIFYNRRLIISQDNPQNNINRLELSVGGADLMLSTAGQAALLALPVTQTLEALQNQLLELDWNNNSTSKKSNKN